MHEKLPELDIEASVVGEYIAEVAIDAGKVAIIGGAVLGYYLIKQRKNVEQPAQYPPGYGEDPETPSSEL